MRKRRIRIQFADHSLDDEISSEDLPANDDILVRFYLGSFDGQRGDYEFSVNSRKPVASYLGNKLNDDSEGPTHWGADYSWFERRVNTVLERLRSENNGTVSWSEAIKQAVLVYRGFRKSANVLYEAKDTRDEFMQGFCRRFDRGEKFSKEDKMRALYKGISYGYALQGAIAFFETAIKKKSDD